MDLVCGDGEWCAISATLLGVPSSPITAVSQTPTGLIIDVETDQTLAGCPACGEVVVGHGRRRIRLNDIPCFGRPVRLIWAKRIWRHHDEHGPSPFFSEQHLWPGHGLSLPTAPSVVPPAPWSATTRRSLPWPTFSASLGGQNGGIETTHRMARGFHNFENYRIRNLLAVGGHRVAVIRLVCPDQTGNSLA